jgi:hypothetical protein
MGLKSGSLWFLELVSVKTLQEMVLILSPWLAHAWFELIHTVLTSMYVVTKECAHEAQYGYLVVLPCSNLHQKQKVPSVSAI